jgi:Family of unknown function (DUF6481)
VIIAPPWPSEVELRLAAAYCPSKVRLKVLPPLSTAGAPETSCIQDMALDDEPNPRLWTLIERTERQAARLATSLARDARIAERKAAREAEAARLQAEAIRQAAEDAARKVTAEAERVVQELALEAERKAARDARY